jgi:hypothetical protein
MQEFDSNQKFFRFCLELHKNKCKNLIRTSKFKFSFRGLHGHHNTTGKILKVALSKHLIDQSNL